MRYFLGFLITIGLIILVIILIFRGPSKPEVQTTSKTLSSYAATDAEIVFTNDGPVNANSEHRAVRITADRNNVSYEELKGYNGEVIKQERYENTTEAYEVFLKALARAGYTKGNNDAALADVEGRCPFGNRYVFELKQDGRNLQRYWATSCGDKTYGGNVTATIRLINAQVPNFEELINSSGGLNFSL